MPGDKHRLRFAKSGDLRFLSHLDLMRSVERLCRRAQVPFKSTAGFHPAPRIVCALALPLGVAGRNEVLEIELAEPLEANVLMARMAAHSPGGLTFLNAYAIPTSTCAVVRRAIYTLALTETDHAIVTETAPKLLAQEKVWAARRKPRPRRINIRPYIRELIIGPDALTLDLWVTPYGTARADELIDLLGLPSIAESGATLARSDLELQDEIYPEQPDAPPSGTPELLPLDQPPAAWPGDPEPVTAHWAASSEGPAVE